MRLVNTEGRGYFPCRQTTCLKHLSTCPAQTGDIHQQALRELAQRNANRRQDRTERARGSRQGRRTTSDLSPRSITAPSVSHLSVTTPSVSQTTQETSREQTTWLMGDQLSRIHAARMSHSPPSFLAPMPITQVASASQATVLRLATGVSLLSPNSRPVRKAWEAHLTYPSEVTSAMFCQNGGLREDHFNASLASRVSGSSPCIDYFGTHKQRCIRLSPAMPESLPRWPAAIVGVQDLSRAARTVCSGKGRLAISCLFCHPEIPSQDILCHKYWFIRMRPRLLRLTASTMFSTR